MAQLDEVKLARDWTWSLHNHYASERGGAPADEGFGKVIDSIVQADEDNQTIAKHRVIELAVPATAPYAEGLQDSDEYLSSEAFMMQ